MGIGVQLGLVAGGIWYMLPSIVAWRRRATCRNSIIRWNIALGWTGVVWFSSMARAIKSLSWQDLKIVRNRPGHISTGKYDERRRVPPLLPRGRVRIEPYFTKVKGIDPMWTGEVRPKDAVTP